MVKSIHDFYIKKKVNSRKSFLEQNMFDAQGVSSRIHTASQGYWLNCGHPVFLIYIYIFEFGT